MLSLAVWQGKSCCWYLMVYIILRSGVGYGCCQLWQACIGCCGGMLQEMDLDGQASAEMDVELCSVVQPTALLCPLEHVSYARGDLPCSLGA